MFEVGFVVGAGREQHGVTAGTARETGDRIAIVAEERRQALHAQLAEEFGKGLADDDRGFRARSRARSAHRRGWHARSTSRRRARARSTEYKWTCTPLGRTDALERAQILRMAEHQMRGHDAVAQQAPVAVDVVQDRVGEARALGDGGFDRGPIVGADDERRDVQLPQPPEPGRFVVDVVRDAVLAHHARRRLDPVPVLVGRHRARTPSTSRCQCGRTAPIGRAVSSYRPSASSPKSGAAFAIASA